MYSVNETSFGYRVAGLQQYNSKRMSGFQRMWASPSIKEQKLNVQIKTKTAINIR